MFLHTAKVTSQPKNVKGLFKISQLNITSNKKYCPCEQYLKMISLMVSTYEIPYLRSHFFTEFPDTLYIFPIIFREYVDLS